MPASGVGIYLEMSIFEDIRLLPILVMVTLTLNYSEAMECLASALERRIQSRF